MGIVARVFRVGACAATIVASSCARRQDVASGTPAIGGDASDGAAPSAQAIRPPALGVDAGAPMRIDAAGANDDPCDVVVADVRKNGPYGLVQIEGPLRDPLCLWRFDDANGGGDEAMMTRFSSAGGTVMSLGSSGTRSSSSILPTMRTLQPAIRKCLEREKLGPAIRLRVRVTAAGAVEGVIFDYRVSTEEHARDCVAFALQRQKFPAEKGSDAGADATTFTLAFSLRN